LIRPLAAFKGHQSQNSIGNMNDRLAPFSIDELTALLFSLDIAATVDPLVPEVEAIRRELIDELKTRGETGSTSKSEGRNHGA
jgi:hypothetical protein